LHDACVAMVGAVTPVSRFEVRLLGPLEVTVEGRPVVIGSPKQRLLLAMLAVHGRCSVDALAEELWDGRPPVSLGPTLQSLVSRLRRVFGDTGSAEPVVRVESDGDGYRAAFAPGVLDFRRFEELVERARRDLVEGGIESAVTALRAALGLWRGAPLAGFSEREFARAEAARLDGMRSDATEELAEAELRAGRPAAALAVVEKHLADQPLRERAWGQRMLALYRLGRQVEALRAYQTVRSLLAEELGLEPTPALAQLEALILRHDAALDVVDVPPGDARVDEARGPAVMAAFLFTDIVASTRRWQGDHSAMGADLARHDALISDAVRAQGGTAFTHTGDGMAATFPSASSAVVAAVAAQRALLAQDWTGAEPLRVRMAVHVGTEIGRAHV
jgi:DNA-binding SARP family transcriptional activator